MSFKKNIGLLLKKCLPTKIYRIVANGIIIVPSYYKSIIEENEKYLTYSLKEDIHKDILLMRKYAHIIDKGLHRSDASPGHSGNYANLLREIIERLSISYYKEDPTFLWAKSKLEYYDLLQSSPEKFKNFKAEVPKCNITFEQLYEVITQRRSNRDFQERVIDQTTADKLTSIANWASSSCNKQPIEIYTALNPKLAKECLACCKGGTGFSDYIPSLWVFTADSRGYIWPSEMYLPYIDVSLGVQNLLLAAHTLGISGTILSWAQKSLEEEIALRKLLKIPKEYIIICCAVLGYAKRHFLTPSRKRIR